MGITRWVAMFHGSPFGSALWASSLQSSPLHSADANYVDFKSKLCQLLCKNKRYS